MTQKYILKRQIISLGILPLLIGIFYNLKVEAMVTSLSLYFFVVLFITFVPSLRKVIKYPLIVHYIIYFSPMFLPVALFNYGIGESHPFFLVYGILLGTTLLFTNIKHTMWVVSKKNPISKSPISLNEFKLSVFHFLISLLSEEIFYRYLVINILKNEIGALSIVVSSILFVHSHMINRWANKIFTLKSYIYHLIIGITFGFMFYISNSFSAVVCAHMIFNCPQLILNWKRYCSKNIVQESFFDDY